MNQEPAVKGPPLRRFIDPQYRPLAADLAQIRDGIDRLDSQIVALLAERARLVQDATRFKADAYQVSAPARQAAVFDRVRALAQAQGTVFEGFEQIVEQTYRSLVGAFVAREQQFFAQTESVAEVSRHGGQP